MTRFVIDSSAAIEYLLRTPAGRTLVGIFDKCRLSAPEVFDVEILSAMRRLVRRQTIPTERAEMLIEDLAVLPIRRISHRFLTQSAWQHHHKLSAYDAMYVAASAAVDAPLLTADGRLTRAPNLGITVHHVQLS